MTLWQSTRTGQHNLSQSRLSITTWCCKKMVEIYGKISVKNVWSRKICSIIWCSWLYQNSPAVLKDIKQVFRVTLMYKICAKMRQHAIMSCRKGLEKSRYWQIELIKLPFSIYIKRISRKPWFRHGSAKTEPTWNNLKCTKINKVRSNHTQIESAVSTEHRVCLWILGLHLPIPTHVQTYRELADWCLHWIYPSMVLLGESVEHQVSLSSRFILSFNVIIPGRAQKTSGSPWNHSISIIC